MPNVKNAKRKDPKWKAGFNVVYLSDEHCLANTPRSMSESKPELSIRSAVLANAINDIERGKGSVLREAVDWLLGNCDSMPGYSFIDICHIFGISPDAARESILKKDYGKSYLKTFVGRYN